MKRKNFAVMAGIAVMCMAVAPAASVFAEQTTQEASGMIDFDAMVEEGIISEETREKIQSYMEEHRPDGEAPGMNGEAPEMNGEKPEDAPELTEGEAPAMNGERPEGMPGMNGGLLTDLLNDGIITQSEYDAMTAEQGTTAQTGTEEELA